MDSFIHCISNLTRLTDNHALQWTGPAGRYNVVASRLWAGHDWPYVIQRMAQVPEQNRPLTAAQYALLRWMLEHADDRAASFISQLDRVRVTPWRCPCGCASFNMIVEGMPEPSGGMEPLADFTFDLLDQQCGIFPYAQNGVLAGVEVEGYGVDAPKVLPTIESLRVADQPPSG